MSKYDSAARDEGMVDEETLEPTVLPDYRLKKCIGAEKGLVHRYGIEKIGANREENQD